MRALAMMAIPAAAFLVIVGCGGEDDAGGYDTEADVRAALTDYLYASADDDRAAACDALTDEGRMRLVADAKRLANTIEFAGTADDCEEAAAEFSRSFGERREDVADGARELAEGIKSGEIDGDPVKVDIDSDSATVTFKAVDHVFRVPVERVDGDWRLADPSWTALTPRAGDK